MQTKPDFGRPLYLRILCDELRLHGEFGCTGELVIKKINELHGTIDLLFGDVLQRLERNHGPQLVGDALSLLYCARGGLLEREILALLAPPGVSQLPRRLWLQLMAGLCDYLSIPANVAESPIRFFHEGIKRAVKDRYLSSQENIFAVNQVRTGGAIEKLRRPTLTVRVGAQLDAVDHEGLDVLLGELL